MGTLFFSLLLALSFITGGCARRSEAQQRKPWPTPPYVDPRSVGGKRNEPSAQPRPSRRTPRSTALANRAPFSLAITTLENLARSLDPAVANIAAGVAHVLRSSRERPLELGENVQMSTGEVKSCGAVDAFVILHRDFRDVVFTCYTYREASSLQDVRAKAQLIIHEGLHLLAFSNGPEAYDKYGNIVGSGWADECTVTRWEYALVRKAGWKPIDNSYREKCKIPL